MKPDIRRQTAVGRAIRRYAFTLRQGTNPCRADGNSAGQTGNFRNALERAELRYTQVREVLMGRGVSPIQFLAYRNFAFHLDKLCRDYAGETLRERALDAILRWKCYGCRPEILRAISQEVFALDVSDQSVGGEP
jgi:hypothetical protein